MRKNYTEGDLKRAILRKKLEREYVLRLDGEAHLMALVCSEPPDEHKRWSLLLLKELWCIPPKANAAFVCCMDDILSRYIQPEDPKWPLVCCPSS